MAYELTKYSSQIQVFRRADPLFGKLVEIFAKQGHAYPVESARFHKLVPIEDGKYKIVKRENPLEVMPDGSVHSNSASASQRTYAARIYGSDAMKPDEARLFLSGQMVCSVEPGEVQAVASF